VFLALGAGRALRCRRQTTRRQGAYANRGAAHLGAIIFGGTICERRAAASLFLGATARLCLGEKACFLFRLAARGLVTLTLAALIVFLATLRILDRPLAVFDLTCLRSFKRAAARLHLTGRQVVEHKVGPLGSRGRAWRRHLD